MSENFGDNGPEGRESDSIEEQGGKKGEQSIRDFSAKPKKKPTINPMAIMALLAASHGGGMGGPPAGGPPMGGGMPGGLGQ